MAERENSVKKRKFLRTREEAVELVKRFAEENKDTFKWCKVGIYGDFTLDGVRSPSDQLGIVIEVPLGEDEFGNGRQEALDKLKVTTETRIVEYWVNTLKKRELEMRGFRQRHGLAPVEESVYMKVQRDKLVAWEYKQG